MSTPPAAGDESTMYGVRTLVRGIETSPEAIPIQSVVIAGVIAIQAVVGLGAWLNVLPPSLLGLVSGLLVAAGIATVAIDRPVRALVGGGLFLVGSIVAFGWPVFVAMRSGGVAGGFVGMAVLVGFGLGTFRLDAFGNGAIATALSWLARVSLVVGTVALLLGVARLDIARVLEILSVVFPVDELVRPTPGGGAMLGFVAVSWLAYGGLWLATAVIPVESFLSTSPASRVNNGIAGLRFLGGAGLGIGSILLALLYVVGLTGGGLLGLGPITAGMVESQVLRVVLVRVFLAGAGIAFAVVALKYAGGATVGARPGWLPSAVVVTLVLLAGVALRGDLVVSAVIGTVPWGGPILTTVATVTGTVTTGLLLATGGLIGLTVLLSVGPIAVGTGVLPERTAGPRLVLVGVVGGAILVTLAEGPPFLVFAAVVAGILTWDIGEHGASLRADIGPAPARQAGPVIHAAGSLIFGVVVLIGTAGVYRLLVGTATAVPGGLLTAGMAVGALIVLAWLFRE